MSADCPDCRAADAAQAARKRETDAILHEIYTLAQTIHEHQQRRGYLMTRLRELEGRV